MAEKTLNSRLILDRRTHQEWITVNPIAKYGELMIVEVPLDSSTVEQEPCFLLKIGDGVHSYNQLNWFSGLAADVYDWAKEPNKPVYSIDEITDLANTLDSLNTALSQKQPIGNYLTQETADDRYLQLTGTAASATQLATLHNFSITGGATASAVTFNGTQDVTLNITSLDATKLSGIIPTANLPSYVDDVIEYANLQAFPSTGESGKIYVALDTNLTYRWGGSEYVEISPSLALGETSSTAYRGDRGKTAYDHSQMLSGNPHNVTAAQIGVGPGKRTARFTVGTSTAGWTALDCDYLCDGTADDVEINAAIQALSSTGGEIVILDGTYNITATIAMNKDNVKLSGNGNATVLKRMWDSLPSNGVITVTAINGGCCIENLFVDGNMANFSERNNYGIYLLSTSDNTITGNTCNGSKHHGIYLNSDSSNNTITGNTCNGNGSSGIYLSGSENNTVTGNTCNDNSSGIYLNKSSSNTITGNTCNGNSYGIYLSGSDNNTVTGNTYNNNSYGIYLSSSNDNNTVTGNTCNNNSYGIYLSGSNDNNTVTGNSCIRGTGQPYDYTTSQYTIRIGSNSNYNLIAYNNVMGKNVVIDGGTSNTSAGNKYS